jgi:hypothetical protein
VFCTVSENANLSIDLALLIDSNFLSHEFKIIVLIAINHLIIESKDRIDGHFFFYVVTTPTKSTQRKYWEGHFSYMQFVRTLWIQPLMRKILMYFLQKGALKMKNKFIFFFILLGIAGTVYADPSVYVGRFKPYFYNNTLYLQKINVVNQGGVLGCATADILSLATSDTTSPDFKNQYAMVLAAWYSGQSLTITGSGICGSFGNEIILQIKPN